MTDLQKMFKRELAEFERLRLKSVKAQRTHDDAAITLGKPLSNKLKENLDEALHEEAKFKESYARKVFEILSKSQPLLLRRRDREVIKWLDAFGTDFKSLSPELQASLVALVEEKGGQYRLFNP